MAVPSAIERHRKAIEPRPWPALPLYTLAFLNLALSALLSTCLCHEGSALGVTSVLGGLVFLFRLVLARFAGETGNGWIPWAAIFGLSYVWVMSVGEALH